MSRLQTYFSSEFIASGLGNEFYDFITKLTQAKSKTEESSHATEELAKLTSKMGSPDISSTKMRDYLIRLIHCYMLGYKVDFSIIYAIMASQSGETPGDKRVGYLACTLFLKSDNELGIMLVNTLQRDLKSQQYLDVCNALNAICYLDHTEIVDSVLDLVLQTMHFNKQIVRKKAVMALYFLYEKSRVPIERIESALRQALEDKDSSVVFAALSVWKFILAEHAEQYQDVQPAIYAIHKQIIEKRIHKSYMYHGVLAPWAQMDCISIYKIYHEMNTGSPKDLYSTIMACLESMERKVDAAFAIVLECIKLLSDIDPILVHSFSDADENPFDILTWYLNATNHNLKYLGLVGISYVDTSFWKSEWLDGTLLGETIRTSFEDDTILTLALENLDKIWTSQVLKNVTPAMIDALSRNYDIQHCNTMIAYWLINHINTEETINVWFIETLICILAETRKNLDDDYIETQCSLLKQALLGEIEDTVLRESSVNTVYRLLKKTNSDHISPLLIQFSFWTLGENGYLSKYSDVDIMIQLLKWIHIIQDDYLQTCGLQAMKRCILRSKSWLSGIEKLLKEYKKSPVPEKQQISIELLEIISDVDFEKQLYQTDLTNSFTPMSMNPNRPKGVHKFMTDSLSLEEDEDFHVDHASRGTHNNEQHDDYQSTSSSSIQHQQQFKATGSNNSHHNATEIVSSLLDFEFTELTTEEFGKLWLEYKIQDKKRRFDCSKRMTIDKLSQRLSKSWNIHIIQVIGQEFIAISKPEPLLLIHVSMSIQQFELTIKSKHHSQDIQSFLKRHDLI